MKNFKHYRLLKNLILPLLGLASLIWFLIRVIPKPTRASYPCMKTAAPLASGFVIYVIGLLSTAFIFTKAKSYFRESKYILFSVAFVASVIIAFVTLNGNSTAKAYNLESTPPDGPNNPMGEGVGVMPGRVAWIYDPDATNEKCTNKSNDYWYLDKNTIQAEVNKMFTEGLKQMTNTSSEAVAWDSIFHYYNRTHGRGNVGYAAGEKIVMKINQNGGSNPGANINTSPQIVYAIINSLVNTVGVTGASIGFGDPLSSIGDSYWKKINPDFPDVECWGTGSGRTPVVTASKTEKIHSSDGAHSTAILQKYVEATYMINVPVFKKHHRAGISLTCKNHFGSLGSLEGGAWNWHFSLPCPDGGADVSNGTYGVYRCFVDIMGHKDLGGKTILYIIDGLWSSTNYAHPPIKWRMAPFNNDWPSSLFMSQDPVAIESVGFDFLFNEFDENHPTEGGYDPSDNKGPFSHYAGVDDFLHQAADSKNWPSGLIYDPEQDGTPLPASMGTHEHWNNAESKQYSRNLGLNRGIELVTNKLSADIQGISSQSENRLSNYPNPFDSHTTFSYILKTTSDVSLVIYDLKGSAIKKISSFNQIPGTHEIQWNGLNDNGIPAHAGIYVAKLLVKNNMDLNYQVTKIIKK